MAVAAVSAQVLDKKGSIAGAVPITPLQSKFSAKRNLPRSQVRVSTNYGLPAQSGKIAAVQQEVKGAPDMVGS